MPHSRSKPSTLSLQHWQFKCSGGFTMRGEHSTPSGKPLLHITHGNGFSSRTYEPMLKLLTEDFDLFLSDIQGHGDTDHGGAFHGWEANSNYLGEAFLAHKALFGEVPMFALGHSMGAILSAMLCAKRSELFDALVLLDPVLLRPLLANAVSLAEYSGLYRFNPLSRRASMRREQWPSRAEAYAYLHQRGIFHGWTDQALSAYVSYALNDAENGAVKLKCRPSREAEIFSIYPKNLWQLLAKMNTRCLLLYGDRSYPYVASGARHLQRINRQVKIAAVGGHHCFMQERPAPTAKAVGDFLLSVKQT